MGALKRPGLWAGLGLALLLAWVFRESLFGHKLLFGSDALAMGLPVNLAARRSLEAGAWPWWLAELYGGLPGMASFSTDFFHPIIFALHALRVPVAALYAWDMALNVLLGGLGALFFARRALGVSWSAASLCAVFFSLSGTQLSPIYAGHANNVKAIALLPWILGSYWIWAQQGKRWALGLVGLGLGLQILAVGMQIAAYTGLALALSAAWLAWRQRVLRLRAWLGLGLVGILGAALSAPQLLPSMAYKSESLRENFGYEQFTSWSFPPLEAVTWFLPGFFGWRDAAYSGPWDFTLTTEYFGLLPWVLAAAGLGAYGARRKELGQAWLSQPEAWLLALALLGLLSALGKYFPLHYLYYHMPVLKGFRSWVRFLCVFNIAWLALAAMGWDALIQGKAGARRSALVCAGLIAVSGLLALAFKSGALAAAAAKTKDAAGLAAAYQSSALSALGLGALLALAAWFSTRAQRFAALALLLALVFHIYDTHSVSSRYVVAMDSAAWVKPPDWAQAWLKEFQLRPGRVEVIGAQSPNQGASWGFEQAGGYLGVPPRRAYHFREALSQRPERYWQLSNTRLVAINQVINAPWLKLMGQASGLNLYENQAALARAWIVYQARLAKDEDEAASLLAAVDFDPLRSVIVEGVAPELGLGQGQVNVVRRGPGMIELEAKSSTQGLLVIAQAYFSGWSAQVNGQAASLRHANLAQTGLSLGPGASQIVLRYRSPQLGLSLLLGLLGLLGLVALLLPARVYKRAPKL